MLQPLPVALLTIRAWREDGSSSPLRAEIRMTRDVSSGFQPPMTVALTESVVDAVRGFLMDVLSDSGEESPG